MYKPLRIFFFVLFITRSYITYLLMYMEGDRYKVKFFIDITLGK